MNVNYNYCVIYLGGGWIGDITVLKGIRGCSFQGYDDIIREIIRKKWHLFRCEVLKEWNHPHAHTVRCII